MSLLGRRYVFALLALAAASLLAMFANNDGAGAPSVQEYYMSLESRAGYWLLLGRARHCGWWEEGVIWPFPISRAQRTMEDKLFKRLDLGPGSVVLDAGAGSGLVAAYMAGQGLKVHAIDLTEAHVQQSQELIHARHLESQVVATQMDYHNLSAFPDASFDGVYTMETFMHADDAMKVLSEFKRVLKPNGVLVLHEADFRFNTEVLQDVLRLSHCQNMLQEGSYERLLASAGFIDVHIEDLSANILPLWRLLGGLGQVPYDILRIFGLHTRFTNLMSAVVIYRNWDQGRYISLRARSGI